MKKFYGVIAALLFATNGMAFAGDWTFPMFIGFALSDFKAELSDPIGDMDKIKQRSYDFEMGMLAIDKDTGLSFKLVWDFGLGVAEDMDNDFRFDTSIGLGAGWSFIRTDRVTLSAFGMVGFDAAIGSYESTKTYTSRFVDEYGYYPDKIETKVDDSWGDVSAGFDIQGFYWFGGNNFGLYADFGYRLILIGGYNYSSNETRYGSLSGITTYEYHSGSTGSEHSNFDSGSRTFYTVGLSFRF